VHCDNNFELDSRINKILDDIKYEIKQEFYNKLTTNKKEDFKMVPKNEGEYLLNEINKKIDYASLNSNSHFNNYSSIRDDYFKLYSYVPKKMTERDTFIKLNERNKFKIDNTHFNTLK
jgi:hypothetical protein